MENKNYSLEILNNKELISEEAITMQYQLFPELEKKYGIFGRKKCLEDANYHLLFLAEAISVESPEIFSDYVSWAKHMLNERNIPTDDLINNLNIIEKSILKVLGEESQIKAKKYIESGINKLKETDTELFSFIDLNSPYGEIVKNYTNSLIRGERNSARKIINDAFNSGVTIKEIFLNVFQISQYEIGRLWQLNKISVAQEHYSTATTQLIMSGFYPQIFSSEKKPYKLVSTCIQGELHEMGIRMLTDFFEMEGWNTYYLGANTPISGIVSFVSEQKPDVLAISATISYNIKNIFEIVKAVKSNPNCKDVKIMVGGYPFNLVPYLWEKTGADIFASNAEEAILKATQVVNVSNGQLTIDN